MTMDRCSGSHVARVAGVLLVLGFVMSSRLNAQGATSASILGTVMDPAGAAVPNASVRVKNVATGKVQQAPTDSQGRYTIAELSVGTYEAQASASGFQTTVRPGITLTVGAQTVVDFSLTVGQAQQTITVESQVSLVPQLPPGQVAEAVLPLRPAQSMSPSTPSTTGPVCQLNPAVPPAMPPERSTLPLPVPCQRESPQAPPPLAPR